MVGVGFIGETFDSKWKLSESEMLDGGIVRSAYLIEGTYKKAPGFPPDATSKNRHYFLLEILFVCSNNIC